MDIKKYNIIFLKKISLIYENPIVYLIYLRISINFHKPMSIEYIFSITGVFTVVYIKISKLII